MSIWFVSNDLMFGSRLATTVQRFDLPLHTLAPKTLDPTKFPEPAPRLVILDLNVIGPQLEAWMTALQSLTPPPQTIAFGPHVQKDLLAEAERLGCSQVMPRSQFHAQMEKLLMGFVD